MGEASIPHHVQQTSEGEDDDQANDLDGPTVEVKTSDRLVAPKTEQSAQSDTISGRMLDACFGTRGPWKSTRGTFPDRRDEDRPTILYMAYAIFQGDC